MNGILLVDKPAGWTSHDVVAKVRAVLKRETGQKIKVGHTGTLDPAATGLLILVIGSYTKRASEFTKSDKTYEAELALGATSTTGDSEGEIQPFDVARGKPSRQDVGAVLKNFVGKISQTPHVYSAIKVGGQRAYQLARKGQSVDLEPREVTIYEISILDYKYPKLTLKTKVSSGTYIRSLAEDLGKSLGVGAYLSTLRRTEVGDYKAKDAIGIDKITINDIIRP